MANKPRVPDAAAGTPPLEMPQSPPPSTLVGVHTDLFVVNKVGELTATVQRLVVDVDKLTVKVDRLHDQSVTVKAWIAAATTIISALLVIGGFILSAKGTAIMQAVQEIAKQQPAATAPAPQHESK